jgi:hypothetical protein
MEMQYHHKDWAVNATASTAAVPRLTVDAHSLPHMRQSKATKACNAADALDGRVAVQNLTLRLMSAAYGVSVPYISRARRLTPEQRQAVRQGQRPLVLPRALSAPPALPVPSTTPATPPVPPTVMSARERLGQIVNEIGLNGVLDLLAASERIAA